MVAMMKEEGNSMTVNILIKKKDDLWVGHCLELDIVSVSENIDELKSDLNDLITAQIDYAFSHDNLDHLYRPAPSEVWEEFYKCKFQIEDKIKVESESQKDQILKTFVPPWIIAKTCFADNACSA